MNFAIVGCGYVADLYMQTLPGLDKLRLLGVWDRDPGRLAAFTAFHKVPAYASMAALLADEQVRMVVNLTNPRSHFEVSLQALEAGRHVYSEKPLGMTMAEAEALVAAAQSRELGLAAAPCNHLSDVVTALQAAIAQGRLGRVMLAQAEMDDGMVHRLDYANWRSRSGAPWPAKDEFEVGCTIEHAGYQITPLVRLFGPVRRVTAWNRLLVPERGAEFGSRITAPDISMGLLEFDGGIVARLTSSIIAPIDRSLRVIGDGGVATIPDVWDYHAHLRFTATGMRFGPRLARKLEMKAAKWAPKLLLSRRLPVRFTRQTPIIAGGHQMDFSRGPAQLAAQIEQGAAALVGPGLALHVTEVTLSLQAADAGRTIEMRTTL